MKGGIRELDELLESEAFCTGVTAGIKIFQNKIITAHRRKEPIKVGDELFYLQSGRQRLEEMLDKICK